MQLNLIQLNIEIIIYQFHNIKLHNNKLKFKFRSSGSEALKGDFEVANNEYNNKNLLYRIIDRNKSYESINVN